MTLMRILLLLSLCYTGWCADLKVVINETLPFSYCNEAPRRMVVRKDQGCYMECVVDNKPADLKVVWVLRKYVQELDHDVYFSIAYDTETENPSKYRIDKPAPNNWRLRIYNLQMTDQGQYMCRVQIGPQQFVDDSRIISVREN